MARYTVQRLTGQNWATHVSNIASQQSAIANAQSVKKSNPNHIIRVVDDNGNTVIQL